MELVKLSATAMETAEECPARFVANTKAGYGGDMKNDAALKGTACHGALETYVNRVIMRWQPAMQTLEFLIICLDESYEDTFGVLNKRDAKYKDCLDLVTRWHARTSFEGYQVLSTEQKENFSVPTSVGAIPFNFIIDRLDYLGNGEYRVVDYKTLARPLSPDNIKNKLQALVYAMAVAIRYKDAEDPPTKIWVIFDMLRWEGPVGAVFSREELVETWARIKRACEKIIAIDPDNPQETLNDACTFCVRKTTCSSVSKNVDAGGVLSYGTIEEQINARALLALQAKAAQRAVDDLDAMILRSAEEQDVTKISTDLIDMSLRVKSYRKVDAQAVLALVGTNVFQRYGSTGGMTIRMGDLDALLKDPTIDAGVRANVESLIERDYADNPYVETKPKRKK